VLVPSLLRVLLDEVERSEDGSASTLDDRLPFLRMCTSSGEPLPPDLARRFRRSAPRARLLNLYGSSEVAADATAHDVDVVTSGARVPIGYPISNMHVALRDDAMRIVPRGAIGEICVAGPGVARGYFGRPDATAERFVPDPSASGGRLYRTGDLGRLGASGALECLGRRDGQVKLRGIRIELGEVETALRDVGDVRDAVCLVRNDVLIAWVVGSPGLDRERLRDALAERLPRGMVPTAFVFIDALPLNASGKIDKRALASPDVVPASDAFEAPESAAERVVAGIWAEVLEREGIGATTHFYDAGGHSLLAIQVLSRVKSAFRTNIDVRKFMGAMTVRAQVAVIVEAWQDETIVDEIASTILEVEQLSEEELEARLR
jgi:non-ribosomal peptide synthetase component E (peptide arylation enzyme)